MRASVIPVHPGDAAAPEIGEEIRQFTSTFEFKVEFNKSFVEDLVSQAQWAIDNKLAPRPKGDLRELFRSVIHDETLKSINPSRVSLG